jgi:hypothetical protein
MGPLQVMLPTRAAAAAVKNLQVAVVVYVQIQSLLYILMPLQLVQHSLVQPLESSSKHLAGLVTSRSHLQTLKMPSAQLLWANTLQYLLLLMLKSLIGL